MASYWNTILKALLGNNRMPGMQDYTMGGIVQNPPNWQDIVGKGQIPGQPIPNVDNNVPVPGPTAQTSSSIPGQIPPWTPGQIPSPVGSPKPGILDRLGQSQGGLLGALTPLLIATLGGKNAGYMAQGYMGQQQLEQQNQLRQKQLENEDAYRRASVYADVENARANRGLIEQQRKNQVLNAAVDDLRQYVANYDTSDPAAVGQMAQTIATQHNLPPEDAAKLEKVGVALSGLKPKVKAATEKEYQAGKPEMWLVNGKEVPGYWDANDKKVHNVDTGEVIAGATPLPKETRGEVTDEEKMAWYAERYLKGKDPKTLTPTQKVDARLKYEEELSKGKGQWYPGQFIPGQAASGQILGTYNKVTGKWEPLSPGTPDIWGGGTAGIPQTASDQLYGMKTSLDQLEKITPKIESYTGFGPVVGRVTLAEVATLGGLGADKKDIELATRLHRLVTSEAFANGGKQLTPTELEQFRVLNPTVKDTFDQALMKAKLSVEFLRIAMRNRIASLPPRSQEIIDKSILGAAGMETPTTPKKKPTPKTVISPTGEVTITLQEAP